MGKTISFGLTSLSLLVATAAAAQQAPTPAMPYASRQVIPVWDGQIRARLIRLSTRAPAHPRCLGEDTHRAQCDGAHLDGISSKIGQSHQNRGHRRARRRLSVLAIDEEGYPVAEWFSQHGITDFVLKYRLAFTPGTDQEFAPNLLAPPIPRPTDGAVRPGASPPNGLPEEAQKNGIADGIQALKVVRANAVRKAGNRRRQSRIHGLFLGGVVTSGVMLADNAAERPNFVAPIYGAPFGAMPNIPSGTPPAFIAVAEDDPIAAVPVLKFFDALRAAEKLTPELHVFRSGQHGFSMSRRGTSDHWIDELCGGWNPSG